MPRRDESCPLMTTCPRTVERVRSVLDRAGYSEPRILEVFQAADWASLPSPRHELPLLLYRTRGRTPLDVFLRLFYLGVPADVELVRAAVAPMLLEEWVVLGLIRLDNAS